MEARVASLKNDHVDDTLEVLVAILQDLDYNLAHIVSPLLCILGVVTAVLESLKDQVVNLLTELPTTVVALTSGGAEELSRGVEVSLHALRGRTFTVDVVCACEELCR